MTEDEALIEPEDTLSPESIDLTDLARKLDLTHKQIRYAQARVLNPGASLHAVASLAGFKSTPNGLHTTASVMNKDPRVQEYMAAFVKVARERPGIIKFIPSKVTAEIEHLEAAIAEEHDVMEVLTRQMNFRVGDYIGENGEPDVAAIRAAPPGVFSGLKVATTTDAEGQVYARWELPACDPQGAARALAKIMGMEKKRPKKSVKVNVALILQKLPIEALRELVEAMKQVETKEIDAPTAVRT